MLPSRHLLLDAYGFQRVADLILAAADQQPRGFPLGATSGSHHARRRRLVASGRHQPPVGSDAVPNCRAYDPAVAERRWHVIYRPRHAIG